MENQGDIRWQGPFLDNNTHPYRFIEVGAMCISNGVGLDVAAFYSSESTNHSGEYREASLVIQAGLSKEQILHIIDKLRRWAEEDFCGRCGCYNGDHHRFCKIESFPDNVVRALSEWEDIPEDIDDCFIECPKCKGFKIPEMKSNGQALEDDPSDL